MREKKRYSKKRKGLPPLEMLQQEVKFCTTFVPPVYRLTSTCLYKNSQNVYDFFTRYTASFEINFDENICKTGDFNLHKGTVFLYLALSLLCLPFSEQPRTIFQP